MINQVASRYAEAMFDLAEEVGQVSEIYSEILDLSKVITENRDLADVLRSPFIPKSEKKELIDRLFSDRISKNVRNFLMVLIDNNRTTQISGIAAAYKQMLDEKNNVVEGVVITAIPLNDEQIAKLEKSLSAKYEKSVKLVNQIDESILGGAMIKIGNEQIDGSVKTKLDNLKEVLSQVIS